MGSINSEEIISILKTEIENYDMVTGEQEVGSVIWVGDGIATIYGIEHAMYGEIVIFENGVRGMVQDIKRDQIGCIILGKDTGIKEGTKVTRTKKRKSWPSRSRRWEHSHGTSWSFLTYGARRSWPASCFRIAERFRGVRPSAHA